MLTRRMRRGKRPGRPTKDEALAAGMRMMIAAINDSMIISAAALHDEFGFGEARMKRFLQKRSEILEACFQEDMLDVESVEKVLIEEGLKCITFYKYEVRIEE